MMRHLHTFVPCVSGEVGGGRLAMCATLRQQDVQAQCLPVET